jgi:hypothetical protein
MGDEKSFTLRQSHRMRGYGSNTRKSGAGATDQVMLDGKNRFRNNSKVALQQQVINANHRARQRILDGSQESICLPFANRAKRAVKCRAGNRNYRRTQQLHSRSFAERSRFALKGYAHHDDLRVSD